MWLFSASPVVVLIDHANNINSSIEFQTSASNATQKNRSWRSREVNLWQGSATKGNLVKAAWQHNFYARKSLDERLRSNCIANRGGHRRQ